MNDEYDLAIIGSGGAAFAAAIRASSMGARVVVVERDEIGGTCVNIGCVPSKTMLAGADALHRAGQGLFDGISTSAGTPDLGALVAQKDDLVAGLRQAKYVDLAPEYGFEILRGHATFDGDDRVLVADQTIRATAYLIATGADQSIPEVTGLREAGYLTSTTAMNLKDVPRRLTIIGGGFVGMEQGQLFSRLGSQVTIVGRLAPHAEPELAEWIGRVFADEGITVIPERAVTVETGTGATVLVTDKGTRINTGVILAATGRHARVADLGLDRAGVELDQHGFVRIDEHQRTTNARVFAAGDVTGGPQFVYTAAAQGAVAAENALTGTRLTVDYTALPSVIFTSPALASVGRTEADVLASAEPCECRVLQLADLPRAIVNRDTRGAIKMLINPHTRKILGVHAVAENAGELLLPATYAIKFGLTVEDVATTWAPYLTLSEGLKLVAQSFRADIKKLSCCAS